MPGLDSRTLVQSGFVFSGCGYPRCRDGCCSQLLLRAVCLAHDEVLPTREYRSLIRCQNPETLEGLPDDQPESINCFFAGLGYDARMLQAGLSLLGIRRSHQNM